MYLQVWCFLGFFVYPLCLENVGLVQLRTAFYKFNLVFKFSLLCLQWFCAATILLLSSYANLVSFRRLWQQLPIWIVIDRWVYSVCNLLLYLFWPLSCNHVHRWRWLLIFLHQKAGGGGLYFYNVLSMSEHQQRGSLEALKISLSSLVLLA